jgi:hypothetical protein
MEQITAVPRTVAEAVKLLASVREAPDSNLGHNICSFEIFLDVREFLQANTGIETQASTASFRILSTSSCNPAR